jgi:hypothetical protein
MQGDFFRDYLFSIACLIVLVPLLLGLCVMGLVRRCTGRRVWEWLKAAIGLGCAAILLILFIYGSECLEDRWENNAVRDYVARATPVLDKIKSQTGSYPSSLPVLALGEPPDLLKMYGGYSSDGQHFRFEYVDDPAGWAGADGALIFESSDRRWKYDR